MNILFLDGSPKNQNSASSHLLKGLSDMLGDIGNINWCHARSNNASEVADSIIASDALVIAFPLYVDGIPSHLLSFLEGMELCLKARASQPRVYVICNAGFYDSRQTCIALDMMKVWCEKSKLSWGQGLGAGAGGMVFSSPLGRGPMANLGRALSALAQAIRNGEQGQDIFVEPNFPRFLYKEMAHMGWRLQAKQNGVSQKTLHYKRRFDGNEP